MAETVTKSPMDQIGSMVINQLIQLAAGYILALQNRPEESSKVLARIGLPADINITPEAFMKFLEEQKGKI